MNQGQVALPTKVRTTLQYSTGFMQCSLCKTYTRIGLYTIIYNNLGYSVSRDTATTRKFNAVSRYHVSKTPYGSKPGILAIQTRPENWSLFPGI